MATSIYVNKMYVITQVVSKWRHYLLGSHFMIKIDHKSLKNLLIQVIQTPKRQVFLCKLLGFDLSIVYQPRKENIMAVALSRSFENDKKDVIFAGRDFGTAGFSNGTIYGHTI